jgi:hypothetical protein
LLSQPVANVTINYASTKPAEGTVSPASPLTFTASNWSVPQTINLAGVDDLAQDGDQQYQVSLSSTSTDANYSGLPLPSVSALNLDNDVAGILVTPLQLDVAEFGDFDFFEVVLVTQPLANVTVTISSSDTTEGTVDKSSLTFTPLNWNVPQTVTVTGVDDNIVDGEQVFVVRTGAATSTDVFYAGIDADDVTVTNFDDETPGVYVKARRLLKTSESGNPSSRIRMRLTLAPTAPVTCVVTVSDATEIALTPQPSVVTFTAANFSNMQQIFVRGVDDPDVDGDQLVTVITEPCTSADPAYDGFDPRNISVLNRDDD